VAKQVQMAAGDFGVTPRQRPSKEVFHISNCVSITYGTLTGLVGIVSEMSGDRRYAITIEGRPLGVRVLVGSDTLKRLRPLCG